MTRLFQFGPFRLDERARRLTRDGQPVGITPKVFDTLLFLVSNADRAVSREELIKAIWPDTFVEEGNLNYNMSQLRKILGDQDYVQTIPKVGYKFVGPIRLISPEETKSRFRPRWKYWPILGVTLPIAALALWWAFRSPDTGLGQVQDVARITSFPLGPQTPSLSPNGEQVAFSWNGGNAPSRSIYILQIGETAPVQLTHQNADDADPVWSPDGKQIAFLRRYAEQRGSIVLIPALGGAERKLSDGWFPVREYPMSHPMLTWTPDGKSVVFAKSDENGAGGIALLSLETGESRTLLARSKQSGFDSAPAVSPDRKWLAFTRFTAMLNGELMVLRLGSGFTPSGKPIAIATAGQSPLSPNWSPDRKGLVFADEKRILEWHTGTAPRAIYAFNGRFSGITVAWHASGARIVASAMSADDIIWSLSLDNHGNAISPAVPWTGSTVGESQPRFSPDGRRVAFVRGLNGADVWVADADGNHRRPLTHLKAYIAGSARWSPDGSKIAFGARVPNTAQVYVVDVEVGLPKRLTNFASDILSPSWSSDGKSIYAGGGDSDPRVYRIDSATGAAVPLFEGRFPVESDGRLVYAKAGKFGIFARSTVGSVENNPEQRLIDDYTPITGGFVPSPDGIYYTALTRAGIPEAMRFVNYISGKPKDVGPLPAELGIGLTVSPDGRQLLFSARDKTAGFDLLMFEFQHVRR